MLILAERVEGWLLDHNLFVWLDSRVRGNDVTGRDGETGRNNIVGWDDATEEY